MTTSLKNPLSSVFHLISVSWTTLLSLLSSPRVTMHRRTDCTSLLNLELIWNVYNVNIDKIWPEIDLKYVDCSFPQSYSWAPKAWHQPSCHWRNKWNINNQVKKYSISRQIFLTYAHAAVGFRSQVRQNFLQKWISCHWKVFLRR